MGLSWRPVERSSVYVETYLLDIARDAGFEDIVISDLDLGVVTSYTVTNLEPGVEYFIRVKPFNYSDMGGTVYWQHVDVADAWTLGSRLRLRIDSPAQGETLSGSNVNIIYSVTGDSGEVEYVHFQLDDESTTESPETVSGVQQFTDVSPGSHLIHAYLAREDNSTIEGTERSISFTVIAPQAPSPVEWLQVEGNKIVNSSGKPVILRGVNIENREWEWSTSPTIEYERRAIPAATAAPPQGWGANLVVLAVASGPINRNEQLYLDHLDELVALAKANDAYTLLVYRYPEPNDDQPNMPDHAAKDAMASLADRYGDEPAVLYGLQVEPHDVSWSELSPRFVSMIDAIRANNPVALVFVPGTGWGRYTHHALESPIERDNLVYKTHPYDRWRTIQDEYRLAEVAASYPVILGEFGSGSSMDLFDVKALLDFAEAQGIGWAAWLFHEIGCPCLLEKAITFEPSPFGEEVRARLQAISAARRSP